MKINFQNTKYLKTVGDTNAVSEFFLPEFVMVGRSNVGKSSLINALTNNKNLARVSSTPGKTKLIHYFNVDNKLILTDLPGYGYAKTDKYQAKSFNSLADNYLSVSGDFDLVFFLLDIRHKPSAQDEIMFEFLNESQIPYLVVLTKADKMSKQQVRNAVRKFQQLPYIGKEGAIFPVSNSKKAGIKELQDFINEFLGFI